MNYYIEKHDMEIILDALEYMRDTIKVRKKWRIPFIYLHSEEDVSGLFQRFYNSGDE